VGFDGFIALYPRFFSDIEEFFDLDVNKIESMMELKTKEE